MYGKRSWKSNNFAFFKFMLIWYFPHFLFSRIPILVIQTGYSSGGPKVATIWNHAINKAHTHVHIHYTCTQRLCTTTTTGSKNPKKDRLNCLCAWITQQKSHCHFQQYILNYSFLSEDLTFRLGLNTQCPSGPPDCSLFSACQEDTSLDYFLWEVGKQAPRSVS